MSAYIEPTPEEMTKRLVRYKDLVPRTKLEASANTLPLEVTKPFGAGVNYSYMAPAMEANSYITKFAAIAGGDAGNAISLSMAISQPGEGPYAHQHQNTDETFLCLYGTFKMVWGNDSQHSVLLEQYDLLSVPAGVLRTFENVGESVGALFVIIQGDKDKFNDVAFPPELGRSIAEQWGEDVLDQLKTNGRKFTAGVAQ